MLVHHSLSQGEARAALEAGLAAARARGVVVALAVGDRTGEIIACERMDGAPARNLKHAFRKVFTAAEMGRDTSVFGDQLRQRGGDLVQWGDPRLTNLPGGLAVIRDGEVVGAVACGGAPSDVDIEIARAMAAATAA
ncbi:MAG: heme-binding protein [Hyphomonadaceae bacterium]|nr:heme-binding protein [Hyphomonadaceae bacterium]